MSTAEKIYQEVRRLPDALAREVLDFIGYLETKHGLRDVQADDLKAAQESAMNHVWNNREDEVWDGM